jgi:hypothetical protein
LNTKNTASTVRPLGEIMPVKTPQFIPLKPDANGRIEGKGYQCTVCGLTGVGLGEPHISMAGRVCYASPDGSPILVKGLRNGSLLRSNPPAVETVASIQDEMRQLGAGFQERIKAAEEREAAAAQTQITAATPAVAPETTAAQTEPAESPESYAVRLAAATKARDEAAAAKFAAI